MSSTFIEAFKEAGVDVPKDVHSSPTGLSTRKLLKKYGGDSSDYRNEEMRLLPDEFSTLKDALDAESFMEELLTTLDSIVVLSKNEMVTEFVVAGICQLAHHNRSRMSTSGQKKYDQLVIRKLLEAKNKVRCRRPNQDIANLFYDTLASI